MTLSALHADIAARYQRLNQAVAKGTIKQAQAAVLGEQYAYPSGGDALGIARSGAAQDGGINESEHSVSFIISTQDEDRDGDIVISRGGELAAYARNPVVLFGHGSWQVPIGTARSPQDQALSVFLEENRVRAKCYFDMPDPDSAFIFGKVQRGILNATSISFLPVVAHRREYGKSHHEDTKPLGWVFERWEMTEFSVVAIPANAGAIRDSLDSEKSFISPKLQKALLPFAAVAKGRCFSGYCPCPPCEEEMSKTLNAKVLTSGLPGAKKACHKGTCTCKKCKAGKTRKELPEADNATSGSEAAGVHEERNEGQEHEAEQQKAELQAGVDAKMPKLIECGYEPAQAMCLAAHLHGKGLEGDDITGHEEAAKALGYAKDMGEGSGTEGGYAGGEESASLKSFVKAMKKKEADEEEKPEEESEAATAEATDENPAEGETEESENGDAEEQYKPSQKILGHMHNHMKNAHGYLSKEVPLMDHEPIAKAMTAHCKDLEGHMENYKDLAEAHHGMKSGEFDKMCKSLEGGENEEVAEETGAGGGTEATSHEDHGSTEESGQDLIRDYQHPKGGKGGAKKSADPDEAVLAERINKFADRVDKFIFPIAGLHV